jgi:hypothetical protein
MYMYVFFCMLFLQPLPKPLEADDVGRAALGLCSQLSGVRI